MSAMTEAMPVVEFSPTARYEFEGVPYRFIEKLPGGALFKAQTCEGGTRYFSYDDVASFMEKRTYKEVPKYYTPAFQKLVAANGGDVMISDLPKKEQGQLLHKYETVMGVRRILGERIATTDADWVEAIDLTHTEYRKRTDTLLELTKGMSITVTVFKKPSLDTVRKWDKKLRDGGDKPIALRDGRWRSGDRTPRFNDAELEIVERNIRSWLTEKRPTAISQFNVLKAHFHIENKQRFEHGRPSLICPSRSAWYRRLEGLDDYVVVAMRHGIDAADRMYRSTGRGLGVARPGSVSEMDGWVIDLMTLIGETSDEWKQLTDEEKKKAKALRFVVIVVIDVATRCITGIHFCRAENVNASLGAMRLSVEVKTDLVKTLGLRSDWPFYSSGLLSTDNGGPFISDEVTSRALDAFGGVQRTTAGVPWLRPHIERFFRTISRQLIEFFIGRTFSNPAERDEYPADKRAAMTIDHFNEQLIKWVVEVYHHTFQKELGMSPYAFWFTRLAICPPPPPMDIGRIAAIFGSRVVRHLYGTGIQISDILVDTDEVVTFYDDRGDEEIDVRQAADLLGTSQSTVQYLTRYGHLPFHIRANPINGRRQRTWLRQDVAAFDKEFVSLGRLAWAVRKQVNFVTWRLRDDGIEPAIHNAAMHAYRREDVRRCATAVIADAHDCGLAPKRRHPWVTEMWARRRAAKAAENADF